MEDLRGGIVPELLVGGNSSFQGGIKEVCRKVLGGLGTQVEKGTRGGHHILIKQVTEMLDSRENIREELGVEFLKNLVVGTNQVNFMVS